MGKGVGHGDRCQGQFLGMRANFCSVWDTVTSKTFPLMATSTARPSVVPLNCIQYEYISLYAMTTCLRKMIHTNHSKRVPSQARPYHTRGPSSRVLAAYYGASVWHY